MRRESDQPSTEMASDFPVSISFSMKGEALEEEAYETIGYREFLPTPDSVTEARHFVKQVLRPREYAAHQLYVSQLIADELASNRDHSLRTHRTTCATTGVGDSGQSQSRAAVAF